MLLVRISLEVVILANVMCLEDFFHRLLKGSDLVGVIGEFIAIIICHHEALHVREVLRDLAAHLERLFLIHPKNKEVLRNIHIKVDAVIPLLIIHVGVE